MCVCAYVCVCIAHIGQIPRCPRHGVTESYEELHIGTGKLMSHLLEQCPLLASEPSIQPLRAITSTAAIFQIHLYANVKSYVSLQHNPIMNTISILWLRLFF